MGELCQAFDFEEPTSYVDDMAKPPGKRAAGSGESRAFTDTESSLPFPWWGKVLFGAIGLIFVAGTTEVIRVESTLSSVSTKLNDIDGSINELTKRVDNLPQQISKALLSKAQTAVINKDFVAAVSALNGSTATINIAAKEQLKAFPEFFVRTVQQLNAIRSASNQAPELELPLHEARVALAQYRSTLQPLPKTVPPLSTQGIFVTPPPPPRLFASAFTGGAITGVTQKLDHIRWKDYIFVNCVIEYDGGPVELDHVLFVNCTFRVKLTSQASKFTDYAALELPSIFIG